MRLKDKIAAITGAGQGIGFAAAKLFAKEGSKVVLLEINADQGKQAENEIRNSGGEAYFIKVDLSDAEMVSRAFSEIQDRFSALHILYNNASIFLGKHDAKVSELALETWHKVLGCNLYGLFHCCKYGIPLIIESGGGSVITTASSAGVIGIPKCDAYTASKGATVSLTRSMAVEYGQDNVRVNCIAPAAIQTAMVKESNLDDPDFDEKVFLKTTPVRRWGTPEEIANIALFLASDESSYLNGAIIVADGGITIT